MNPAAFIIICVLMLAAALAAATLPKLMHAALSFALAFVALAAFYFLLGAEFVGLVQIFVYIGAVAVLIVFTILLTRREGEPTHGVAWRGIIVALAVLAGLVWTILTTASLGKTAPEVSPLTVKQIGTLLMTDYVWPLQLAGVLLTIALLGALILAMEEKS
jgi:NADH-quinone oxidoreductase subunit J